MEGLRVAIRVPNVPSGPMCSSKASGSRLRHGVDDAFGGCPRKNPDIWGCFQGTWDSLGQDASRGNRGPFSTECGFADWSGVTVVRKLGRFSGVGPPAEAGVFTRPLSLVKPELEILQPDAELGFVVWIKCLWVVNGRWYNSDILIEAALTPVLFPSRGLLKFRSFPSSL